MRSTIGRIRRRLRRLHTAVRRGARSSGGIRSTVVEVFERRLVAGWVEVDRGSGPVRVDLCVNGTPVVHSWAAPDKGRRVYGQLLSFRFTLSDLWKFTQRTDRISVRIEGKPAPIVNKGTYYRPRSDGSESLSTLQQHMAAGYVFGQNGRLQLSKKLDAAWQSAVLGLYKRVNRILEDEFDLAAFLCYGTLLGAVRDNGFIGHDVDFDCAYISRQKTGQAAAEELGEVAFELIDRGFNVVPKRTCLAIKDDLSGGQKIDLYHLFRDDTGRLCFPFGIAGTTATSHSASSSLRAVELAGHQVLIPTEAERLVETIYGSNWRTPNPGFRWEEDRTARSREGIVPAEQVDEVARANVARSQVRQRGLLLSLVKSGALPPETIIEIGSSVGDESIELARAGKRVIGLERTYRSLRRAQERVEAHGLAGAIEFRIVEINDPAALSKAIEQIRRRLGGTSVAYLARSYLGLSDGALKAAASNLDAYARAGDYLVADFRTAPQDRWPHNRSTTGKARWMPTDLLAELQRHPMWSVIGSRHDNAGDRGETGPTLVVAVHR